MTPARYCACVERSTSPALMSSEFAWSMPARAVTSPINGHLAMLFADEGNAWPVVRTALATKVQAGRTLYFPDGIEVLAAPPAGRMRWVAVVTPLPVDWAAQFATGGLQTQQITGAAASVSGEITITP